MITTLTQRDPKGPAPVKAVSLTALAALAVFFAMGPPIDRGHAAEFSPDGWRLAVPASVDPDWTWKFPEVYLPMPEFKTGWWYYTGHLESADGERFGYQLTFFRIGTVPGKNGRARPATSPTSDPSPIRPASNPVLARSAWRFDSLWMAHIAVTDENRKRYFQAHHLVRGAAGLAGHRGTANDLHLWVGKWSLDIRTPPRPGGPADRADNAAVHGLRAAHEGFGFDLTLKSGVTVLQGDAGLSQKADGLGRASHYFTHPRMDTHGTISLPDRNEPVRVTGRTWFDREIGSNQLGTDQSGWDWFAIQLDNGDCLMLYQMRLEGGGTDPHSHGKWMPAPGTNPGPDDPAIHPAARSLAVTDFELSPGKTWRSTKSGAEYPVSWEIRVPALNLVLSLSATVRNQEFLFEDPPSIAYWEGSHVVQGTMNGREISGRAYVEMTGYAGAVPGL